MLALQEILRMYPPVSIGTARVCMNKDTVIGGQLHLPAGTCINLSHHSLQNTSYNWDSPQKFMPGEGILTVFIVQASSASSRAAVSAGNTAQ
jgi:cytochrome P450